MGKTSKLLSTWSLFAWYGREAARLPRSKTNESLDRQADVLGVRRRTVFASFWNLSRTAERPDADRPEINTPCPKSWDGRTAEDSSRMCPAP
ncbi:hypothetical protein F5883DRAFT_226399 [Diaporthe sp. PMI_573]|nr:hypothetical protein F5883DRAFT_226399 [Diaporthaceae sp. PMI_573]